MTADRIALSGLRVRGHHGVFEHERRDGQDFVVDAVLEVSTAAAAASDELTDTVDYGDLAQRIAQVVSGPPVDLIETVAERIARECLGDAGCRRPRSPCTSRRPRSRSRSPMSR